MFYFSHNHTRGKKVLFKWAIDFFVLQILDFSVFSSVDFVSFDFHSLLSLKKECALEHFSFLTLQNHRSCVLTRTWSCDYSGGSPLTFFLAYIEKAKLSLYCLSWINAASFFNRFCFFKTFFNCCFHSVFWAQIKRERKKRSITTGKNSGSKILEKTLILLCTNTPRLISAEKLIGKHFLSMTARET